MPETATAIKELTLQPKHEALDAEWTNRHGWRLPLHYGDPAKEYEATQNGCAVIDKSYYGRINVSGGTAQDFLHRMTSAPVNDLGNLKGMETVITTAEGRFVDWVTVYKPHGEHLTLVTGPESADHIIDHLEGYIFFKEEVEFENTGDSWSLLQVSGPEADNLITESFSVDVADAELYAMHPTKVAGEKIYISKVNDITGNDYHIFCPQEVTGQVWKKLENANISWQSMGIRAYEYARITAGIPQYPHEITDEYTLVEAHLQTPLDLSSCFAGQEVIARTINYDKVKQHLCHIEIADDLPEDLTLPVDMTNGERTIGTITSVSRNVSGSGCVALGYVKTRYLEIPMKISIEAAGKNITGKITGKTAPR